jgi:hypothetical protein
MLNSTDRRLLNLAVAAVAICFLAVGWTNLATLAVTPSAAAQDAAVRLALCPGNEYAERLAATRAELDKLPANDASRDARQALAAYSSDRDTTGFANPELTRRMLAAVGSAEQTAAFDRRRLANFWIALLAVGSAALAAASVIALRLRLRRRNDALPGWATRSDRDAAEVLAEELVAIESTVEELKTERIALARDLRERDDRIRELMKRPEVAPPVVEAVPTVFTAAETAFAMPIEEPLVPLVPEPIHADRFIFDNPPDDGAPDLFIVPEALPAPPSGRFSALASLTGSPAQLENAAGPLVAVAFADLDDFRLAYADAVTEVYLNTAARALFKIGVGPEDLVRRDDELIWAVPRALPFNRAELERDVARAYADELVEFEGRLIERPALSLRVIREGIERRLAETDRRAAV